MCVHCKLLSLSRDLLGGPSLMLMRAHAYLHVNRLYASRLEMIAGVKHHRYHACHLADNVGGHTLAVAIVSGLQS